MKDGKINLRPKKELHQKVEAMTEQIRKRRVLSCCFTEVAQEQADKKESSSYPDEERQDQFSFEMCKLT